MFHVKRVRISYDLALLAAACAAVEMEGVEVRFVESDEVVPPPLILPRELKCEPRRHRDRDKPWRRWPVRR